jgi:hypothetical protein
MKLCCCPGNGLRSRIRSVAATNIRDRRALSKEVYLDRIADEGVATPIHVLLPDHERAPAGRHSIGVHSVNLDYFTGIQTSIVPVPVIGLKSLP